MSLYWLVTNSIAAFLLPPLNLLLLGGAGLLVLRHRPLLGRALLVLCLAGLWLLSLPAVSGKLLDALKPPFVALDASQADAIVILGGGINFNTLEYQGDSLGRFTLERVRYGARLARQFGKPVLVTGGSPDGGAAEGPLMQAALEREYQLHVRWTEGRSINTRENARLSAVLLREAGIRRIFLVSHAWHLARAIPEFEREGLVVVPAGIGYGRDERFRILDYLPSGRAMENSYFALHEGIGLIWYRLRAIF